MHGRWDRAGRSFSRSFSTHSEASCAKATVNNAAEHHSQQDLTSRSFLRSRASWKGRTHLGFGEEVGNPRCSLRRAKGPWPSKASASGARAPWPRRISQRCLPHAAVQAGPTGPTGPTRPRGEFFEVHCAVKRGSARSPHSAGLAGVFWDLPASPCVSALRRSSRFLPVHALRRSAPQAARSRAEEAPDGLQGSRHITWAWGGMERRKEMKAT